MHVSECRHVEVMCLTAMIGSTAGGAHPAGGTMLLQGEVPSIEQTLKVRNDLLQSADLRAPQNLAQQIHAQKGITEEAGRSLVSLFQVRLPP